MIVFNRVSFGILVIIVRYLEENGECFNFSGAESKYVEKNFLMGFVLVFPMFEMVITRQNMFKYIHTC